MTPYKSKSGKTSGIAAYEIGEDFIKVRFANFKTYNYPTSLNGQSAIDSMKSLALDSNGLNTFIAKNKTRLKFI